jgi:F-type H+-transporting ATPase subunit a
LPQQQQPIQLAQGHTEAPPSEGQHSQTPVGEHETAAGAGHEGATHAGTEHGGHHQYKLGDIPDPSLLFMNAICVAVIMIVLAVKMASNLQSIPKGMQNFGEWIVERMTVFTRGIIGPGGEKYVPLIGTLFWFILCSNLWAMIPGFHAPTTNLSMTLALGFIIFFYVQYVGIRSNGFVGHFKHFMGPMPALSPLIMPVEIISELVKPFTLAMRLFGNIFGEDTVIIALAMLGIMVIPAVPVVAVQIPVLVLALLTSVVQALVFSLLACIYISLVSHHGHSDDHAHEGHGEEAHAH